MSTARSALTDPKLRRAASACLSGVGAGLGGELEQESFAFHFKSFLSHDCMLSKKIFF